LENELIVYVLDSLGTVSDTFSESLFTEIECAYDPNDKTAEPEGIGASNYIPVNQELTYTIRFQNTGNATATNVVIIDTLDNHLNYSTFNFIASSHLVNVSRENNLLTFRFDSIMLPDSSANEFSSHGFVKYAISPLTGLVPNVEITNRANIFFDYNPAILTNTTLNTIECYIVPTQPIIEYQSGYLVVSGTGNYQWLLDGIPITGATGSSLFPEWTGEYTVIATNIYGCTATSNPYDYLLDKSIIDDKNGIKIFPNPSSNVLNIEGNDLKTVAIYSLTGNEILRKSFDNNFKSIDISSLHSGLYFIKIESKNTVVTYTFTKL
jgi:uncharacterized repeat protein (TIGR01451 family)